MDGKLPIFRTRNRRRGFIHLTTGTLFLTILLIVLSNPATVYARDCPPNDPSRSDCQVAATTARNPMVPIGGAVAGTLTGVLISQALDKPSRKPSDRTPDKSAEEQEPDRDQEDPCQAEKDRLALASGQAKALLAARQNLQNLLTMLDMQYESTRQASYLSGAVDLGFLGGSIFSRPIIGALGIKVKQTLAQKAVEAALKAFGQQVAKDVINTLNAQGMNWEDLLTKPKGSVQQMLIQEAVSEAIVDHQMDLIARSLQPNGPVYQAIERGIKTNLATPVANMIGDVLGVVSMAEGVISGAQKLKAIREQMSKVSDHLLDVDLQLRDALDELEIARHSYNYCRKLWEQ